MPYTNAQLTAYYTSLTGVQPTGADAILINAYANQSQSGTLSDVNALLGVFNAPGVQGTFEVAESTYEFFTGGGLNAGGLAAVESTTSSGTSSGLNSSYFAQFNTENRYYNFAINLASAGGQGNAAFVANYGNLTFAQTVSAAYETIVGSSNVGSANAQAAIADIISRQSFFTNVAQQRAGGVDAGGAAGQNIALKAIVIGYILEEANKADVGTYAKAIDQVEASIAAGNAQLGTDILTTYGPNGSGFNTGFNALVGTNTTQTNVPLTTGIDTIQPTTGNIQFIGTVNATANANTQFNPSTLNAGDQIRGTGANNTLSITTVGVGAPAAGAPAGSFTAVDATGGALISGIQTINVRAVADPQGQAPAAGISPTAAGAQLNANLLTGETAINAYAGTGQLNINNLGSSVAVGIIASGGQSSSLSAGYSVGGTAVVNIAGGTSTFISGAASAGSSYVNLFNQNGDASATTLSTVQLNSNGGLNNLYSFNVPVTVTELDIASTSPLRIGLYNTAGTQVAGGGTIANGLKILRASGSGGDINLGSLTDLGGGGAGTGTITTVDTTGLTSTGGLTARFFTTSGAAGTTTTYALGAGADRLTLDGNLNGTQSINLGGGSNSLVLNGNTSTGTAITGGASTDTITINGNVGAGTSINTGGGGDTVNITGTVTAAGATAATQTVINGGGNATLVTNAADLQTIDGFGVTARTNITGFSTVGVYNALTGGVFDVNAIGAQNFATVGAATASTIAVNTGATVSFIGNIGNGVGAGGGTLANNTAAITIAEASAAAGATTGNTLTVGYSNQFPAGAVGAAAVANVTSTLNTTGVNTLTFSGTEVTRGNGHTGVAGTTGTTVTLALTDANASSITFSGNDGFIFAPTSTAAVAGGAAASGFTALKTINGATATGDLSIDVSGLNAGNSTLNSPVVVTTGGGNDVVTVRDFAQVTTGAATVATATTTAGFNTINVGVTTSGQTYSTVLDAKATDHIGFAGATSVNTTKIVLASTAGFQDYLDAAAAGNATHMVSGFDFGGNTYLVVDNNAAATFQNNQAAGGGDSVIQLVGIHTLTNTAAGGAGVVILGS